MSIDTTQTVDNIVQEYTVVIRSMSGVHPDTLRDHLQKKWEVLRLEKTGEVILYQGK